MFRKEIYGLILLMMENFRIFSFRKETDGDFRDSRYQHNIKIIRVEDNGDVDFVLYWIYEQRRSGRILWRLCISLQHDQNVVEEKVFIPSTESYEFLKEDLGTLSYVSTENALYLYLQISFIR